MTNAMAVNAAALILAKELSVEGEDAFDMIVELQRGIYEDLEDVGDVWFVQHNRSVQVGEKRWVVLGMEVLGNFMQYHLGMIEGDGDEGDLLSSWCVVYDQNN